MKPPPSGIVWSGRRRRCPRCGNVVTRAWVVEGRGVGETEREWSCVDCLTPLDYGANGEPLFGAAFVPTSDEDGGLDRLLGGL